MSSVAAETGNAAHNVISSGADEVGADEKSALPIENEGEALTTSWEGDQAMVIPAANKRINETMTLQARTVAQAESTRNYFLAQTLESTRTVPIVSANLPLDTGNDSDAATEEDEEGSDDESDEDSEPVGASFSLRADDSESATGGNGIALSSTVVGSFTSNGITYAVEPGGETVAVVAVDCNQLPEQFIEQQTIVIPSAVTADGIDYYTVSRIADYAFAGITAAAASENSGVADAPSDIQRGSRPPRYEDQASSDESQDGTDSAHVISTEASDSERSGEISSSSDDDGIINAVAIPVSVTSIGDDAFTGASAVQYVIVADDNPNYSMYDGVLYNADQTCLLLIPEGRTGAVRVADSTIEARVETFSHHADLTLYVNADSAAFTSENGFLYNYGSENFELSVGVIKVDSGSSSGGFALYEVNYDTFIESRYDPQSLTTEDVQNTRVAYGAPNNNFYGACVPLGFIELSACDNNTTNKWDASKQIGQVLLAAGGPTSNGAGGTKGDAAQKVFTLSNGEVTTSGTHNSHWRVVGYADKNKTRKINIVSMSRGTSTAAGSSWVTSYTWASGVATGLDLWFKLQMNIDYGVNNDALGKVTIDNSTVFYTTNANQQITLPRFDALKNDNIQGCFTGWSVRVEGGANNGTNYQLGFVDSFSLSQVGGYDVNSVYRVVANFEPGFNVAWDTTTFGSQSAACIPNSDHVLEKTTEGYKEIVPVDRDNAKACPTVFPSVTHPTPGVTFVGWTDVKERTDRAYCKTGDVIFTYDSTLSDPNSFVSTSNTWYAVWTVDTTFVGGQYGTEILSPDAGSTNKVVTDHLYNTAINPPPVRDLGSGYTFLGWLPQGETPSVSSTKYVGANAAGTTSFTLLSSEYMGVWKINSITFDAGEKPADSTSNPSFKPSGTSKPGPSDVLYGAEITCPTADDLNPPTGYAFGGWMPAGSTDVVGINGKLNATSTSYTAKWIPISGPKALKFNDGRAATDKDQQVFARWGEALHTKKYDVANDAETNADLTVPVRPGFIFNGYWKTPSSEANAADQYYKANADSTAVVPVSADKTWDLTQGELYAHWKYKIYLNTNEWYLGAAQAEHEATIAGADALPSDANGTYLFATVGEPVQLPEVTGRPGYKDDTSVTKNAWGVRAGSYGAATGFIPLSNGSFTSQNMSDGNVGLASGPLGTANINEETVWGEPFFTDEAKTNIAYPQPEADAQIPQGAGSVDNPEYQSITLYLDWSKRAKQYTINLVAAYDDDVNKVTYGAQGGHTTTIAAQYDAPLLKKLADGTVVTTIRNEQVTAPTYKKVTKAGYESYDDQVFGGYYDQMTGGTQYIGAQTEGTGNTITSSMTPALAGPVGERYSTPFRLTDVNTLWARWTMPVCEVTFDMNGGKVTDADGAAVPAVEKAFTIKTGAVVPEFGTTNTDAYGKTHTDFLATAPYFRLDADATSGSDYTFAGYFDANGKQYYRANCEPVAGITWDKYVDTTLYARWTYTVELNLAAECPQDGLVDSLLVLGGSPAGTTGEGGQHVVTVIYGGDATIPATVTAVQRLRGEPVAEGETAKPKKQTGYEFAGWYTEAEGGTRVGTLGADLKLTSTNKDALKPSDGVAQLYARWAPVEYPVRFDYTSGGAFSKVDNFREDGDGGRIFGKTNTTVAYDGTLLSATEPVAAPQLMGWVFQGYWTKPQAASDVNDEAADKGVQYAKPVEGDPTRMAGIDALRWTETSDDEEIVLYAHYTRIPYQITFDVNAGTDKVTNTANNAVTNESLGAMATYFDMDLSGKPTHQVRRTGYTFKGWSTEADYDKFAEMDAAEQAEALFFGSDGNGVAGKRYRLERSLELHALWGPIEYAITWDMNFPEHDGTVEETTAQDYGRDIAFPEDPEYLGFEFLGWFEGPEDEADAVAAGKYLVAGPSRYYAHWGVKKYHLTLLPGDFGTYSDTASATDGKVQADGSYLVEFTIYSADGELRPYRQPSWTSGYKFVGWEQLVEGEPATGVYRETDLSKEGGLTAVRLRTEPDGYDGAVFRAMWDTQVYTLSLDAKGGTLSGGWAATKKFTVEDTLTLPQVTKLGYTFTGWYAKDSDERVTVVTAGTTKDLAYEARFDKNVYQLQFVLGDGAVARNVLVADPVFVSLGDDPVVIPYPMRYDTFADDVAAVGKKPCSIFWHYQMTDELARTRYYHADDTVSVDDLLTNAYLRDADGNPLGNGSVIKFYADWTSSYQVSVPLTVEISFDPLADDVEETILVGDHYMQVTNESTEGDAIEVARVICEPTVPTAASGTAIATPGTRGVFAGEGGTDLTEFVTLTLSARAKDDASPLRFAMDDVADTATTTSVTHLVDEADTPAELKTLGGVGFRFGGKTGIKTLPLYFNLEFANADGFTPKMLKGLEPIKDRFVLDENGKPTAQRQTYPIAKLYYVLALDHERV